MAIFNRSNGGTTSKFLGATTIANGTTINGEIKTQCSIHVDGKVEGSIRSSNLLTIGKTGFIEGTIKVDKLVVSGVFNGEVEANEIEILENGCLRER